MTLSTDGHCFICSQTLMACCGQAVDRPSSVPRYWLQRMSWIMWTSAAFTQAHLLSCRMALGEWRATHWPSCKVRKTICRRKLDHNSFTFSTIFEQCKKSCVSMVESVTSQLGLKVPNENELLYCTNLPLTAAMSSTCCNVGTSAHTGYRDLCVQNA